MSYIGTQPNDVKKNIGLYTPSEILQLTKDGSWGGSLELIEEQNITSSTATVEFTNLANSPYDVYFLTADNVTTDTDSSYLTLQFQMIMEVVMKQAIMTMHTNISYLLELQ